jgi:hypothetical protein
MANIAKTGEATDCTPYGKQIADQTEPLHFQCINRERRGNELPRSPETA